MTKLPAVFSGMAVLFGILMLVKFKENRLVALLFYLSLVGSGLSRIFIYRSLGRPVSFVDVGVVLIFGISAVGDFLILLRERRERAGF